MKRCGLQLRHELKYYINYVDYLVLRKKLSKVLKLDSNSGPDGNYLISSIYFDDVYNTSLFEKNFGVENRVKYRIRGYNKIPDVIKLEKKIKFGQYIAKESSTISKAEYDMIFNENYEFLYSKKDKVRNDYYIKFKSNILRPKVIVDYEREAYISNISQVRITFDMKLRTITNTNDIFDKSSFSVNMVSMPTLIMEVKYNEFLPNHIRGIVKPFAREHCAISKYVICRVGKNNI